MRAWVLSHFREAHSCGVSNVPLPRSEDRAMDDAGAVNLGVEKLIGRKEGAIGWMIFNNPERRNAVSLDMWRAIPDVLAAFEADPEVRVVVFTGAGDRAFVSGADISQFEAERSDSTAEARYSGASAAANVAMAGLSKPSI